MATTQKAKLAEPGRTIHLTIDRGDGTFWALLDCGHASLVTDKYMGVSCPCCMGSNRKWNSTEFKKEFGGQ
jgi:hypothetical protein